MHDDESRSRLIAQLQNLENLENRDPRTLSKDLRNSLTCWQIERRLRSGLPADPNQSRRLSTWITTLLDVDAFVAVRGVLPRENNRKRQDPEEARLAFWLRYQRRRAIAGDLCTYQQLSLDALTGFSWAPVDDAWDANFVAYERFLDRERRAPRYRATDLGERRLAAWAAKQRHAAKRGRLDEARTERLGTLSIRILPTRRTPPRST